MFGLQRLRERVCVYVCVRKRECWRESGGEVERVCECVRESSNLKGDAPSDARGAADRDRESKSVCECARESEQECV